MTDSTQPAFKPSARVSAGSMTRSAFFALTPHDQARAIRDGWSVTEDPPGSAKAPTITRAVFNKMPVQGREMFLSRGGNVSD